MAAESPGRPLSLFSPDLKGSEPPQEASEVFSAAHGQGALRGGELLFLDQEGHQEVGGDDHHGEGQPKHAEADAVVQHVAGRRRVLLRRAGALRGSRPPARKYARKHTSYE